MQFLTRHLRLAALTAFLSVLGGQAPAASPELPLLTDSVLDASALLMPRGALYGPAINGSAHQNEALLTYGGYQYAVWYHRGRNEDLLLGRRSLTGATWEVMDTGVNLDNGDSPSWDAHNVISLGIAGDGSLHLAYDHHNDDLRYMTSVPGAATAASWDASLLNAERDSLNVGGPTLGDVTYPRFIRDPSTGALAMTYRTGSSGNGNVNITTLDSSTSTWAAPQRFVDGTDPIFYNDPYGSGSNNRNAYLNGLDIDSTGRMHTTWTWRESATGSSNHDIAYAYSDDNGATWRNNDGAVIGTPGSPITLNSPGATVVPLDRGNTLMNQQTQIVDPDGRVHTVMWHKTDDAAPLTGFTTGPAAYYHYFRDPSNTPADPGAAWVRTELPTQRAVGSRPDMGYDADGNLYVTYLSPGPGDGAGVAADYYTNGDLIIATASKASRWTDWEIVRTDARDFVGEPVLDHARLADSGVVSVFVQENGANQSSSVGTPLRVLEFGKLASNLVWSGANSGGWSGEGIAVEWDSQGDDLPDAAYSNLAPTRVTFDDGAAAFNVEVASQIAPVSTTFRNAVSNYTLTGGGIGGAGDLRVLGGGRVTLAGAANTYSGETAIERGVLALQGGATLAGTPRISVAPTAELDVSQLDATFTLAAGQQLVVEPTATVRGAVHAAAGGQVTASGAFDGTLSAGQGGVISVGEGVTVIGGLALSTLYSDTFSGAGGPLNGQLVESGDLQTGAVLWSASSAFRDDGTIDGSQEGGALLEFHPQADRTYTLTMDVTNQTDRWIALGFGQDPIASPGQSSHEDRHSNNRGIAWMLYRDTQDGSALESFIGTNTGGPQQLDASGVDFGDASELKIVIDTTGDGGGFSAQWYVDDVLKRTEQVGMSIDAINYVGLSFDNSTAGSVSFDNFRLTAEQQAEVAGVTELVVQGDLDLQQGALLSMDIATPDAHDTIVIGQTLRAGGELEVTLADGAFALQAGDRFDLFDFAAASGFFDELTLPQLSAGLVWDAAELLTLGMLEVAVGLPGDFNADGVVDAADYTVWRDTLGAVGAGLAADANLDSRIDGADYAIWRASFGDTLSSQPASAAAVPEPAALLLAGVLLACGSAGRVR
ncbi:hypothetical protein KOR34_13880 [Posidoniimonas corsicana]|uniref:Autotransporter-associated beta strand repeat protein n=1 Tax=Posidoniimonas corsicana TaxID=1938618 RepID=A0A5C5VFQ1_9BACT|nr:BNR-4 repeat-containing protein [Posidoniimonas corsicana]TWT36482.1 hypothetical protein KOR34_13880 [Posidoniimonas corsicana]